MRNVNEYVSNWFKRNIISAGENIFDYSKCVNLQQESCWDIESGFKTN